MRSGGSALRRGDDRRRHAILRTALLACSTLTAVTLPAAAQSYTWGGTGSTTTTSDYNLGTNWSNPPAVAPPVAAGQAASFASAGATLVIVTAGPIAPDSWTFQANAQNFVVIGSPVNFSLAGATGGLINNANAGQFIIVDNALGGAGVQLQQLGNSTLTLLGVNSYTGGTTVNAGSLHLGSDASTAAITGSVVVNGGFFNVVNANTAAITSITTSGNSATQFFGSTSAGTATVTTNANAFTNFVENSTGGSATIVTNSGGFTQFSDNSNAANATLTANAGGTINFAVNATAGSASITNNGTTNFGDNSNAGNAFITNNSNGVTNFGSNATAANATITNNAGGVTQFFDTSTAANAILTVNANGAIGFNNSSTAGNATITTTGVSASDFGVVNFVDTSSAGTARITNNDGLTQFFNNSTAGNATIVNTGTAGILGTTQFNGTSTAGNAIILNEANGVTQFVDTSTAANATLTANAGGAIGFNNSSTAGNATITTTGVSASDFGVVNFVNTSSAGTARITNNDGLTLFFDNSTAGNATIVNTGTAGNGLTQFFGSSTAANATITNTGTSATAFGLLNFLDNSTAGRASITNHDGFTQFAETSTAGNATITNGGSGGPLFGSTIFLDNSTAGNATITSNSAGSTQFRQNSTAGDAIITTNAGGGVFFSDASTGGNARFITNAGGEFDISLLTAAGMTAGSIEGAGSHFLGGKLLTVGGNNLSTEVSGTLADGGGGSGGALTKTGTGTLTLSGTNSYTGATAVNAGTLLVNGSIASSSGLTVNAGAAVGGNGTLPSTTINGTLAPGNSIGAITINGNLVLGAGSIYQVEVSPTAADRTNVTGTATLAGSAQLIFTPGAYSSNTYTILSAAGGRSGTFGTVTASGLPATLSASLSYTATDVLLVTLRADIASLAGLTANQRAVGGAQDAAFNGGLPSIGELFALSNAQLPAALDALSGEVHASTAGLLVDESRYMRGAVLGRLRQASYGGAAGTAALALGGPTAFAGEEEMNTALGYAKSPVIAKAPMVAPAPDRDIVFWAQGFGAWGRFGSDGNATSVRRDLAGFISGLDTRVGERGRAGIAAGYTGSRNSLDGRGSAHVDTAHVAGYGGWSFGALNLRAGGAYAAHSIDTDRTIAFPGFFDRATARYDAGTAQVFGEAGYGFAFGNIAVEPFAGGAWVRFDSDAAAERGGAAALNVAANRFEVGYSALGVRAASIVKLANDMVLIPRASLAWQHAFDSVTPAARLAFLNSGTAFTISGVPIARDALLAEAGLDLAIGHNATVGVSYVGQIAGRVQDHAAKGRFSWKF